MQICRDENTDKHDKLDFRSVAKAALNITPQSQMYAL